VRRVPDEFSFRGPGDRRRQPIFVSTATRRAPGIAGASAAVAAVLAGAAVWTILAGRTATAAALLAAAVALSLLALAARRG
jgi:hypothetical protein